MILSRRSLLLTAPGLLAMPPQMALARHQSTEQSGWWALDLETGRTLGDNPDLALPMCSTFKWLLAAAMLSRVDKGQDHLDQQIFFTRKDLLSASPAVKDALARSTVDHASLSIRELCSATVSLSDSSAANLLLKRLGGPTTLTHWLRTLHDSVTRLDHYEPELNKVPFGDRQDTTTPRAMVSNLQTVLYGNVLTPTSQSQILAWLLAATTGPARLPAGLRDGWRIGHKTGTWTVEPGYNAAIERAASGDVAILLPPQGKPVLVAAYAAGYSAPQSEKDSWFAGIAQRVTDPAWLRR